MRPAPRRDGTSRARPYHRRVSDPNQPTDLHPLERQRRENRAAVAALGLNPYGSREDGLLPLAEAHALYDADADAAHQKSAEDRKQTARENPGAPPETLPLLVDHRPRVKVAGRVVLKRDTGKLVWLNLRDPTREAFQVAVSKADVSENAFALAKLLDLGDVVVAEGPLMKTRTGEITCWASDVRMGAKSLAPPPEKHAGLSDVELRYRQRYVDLWATPETTRAFLLRSRLVARLREFMLGRGYVEVETPMLQSLAGGAAARPFVTHMNALDIPLFLRIAPELYLKRLLVGGLPRVFEVNRNFRNEGLDKQHNPEFTMLEAYEAFGDVESVMELTESLIRDLALEVAKTIDVNPLRKPQYTGGQHEGRTLGEVFDSHPSYIRHQLDNLEEFSQFLPDDVVSSLRLLCMNPNWQRMLEPIYVTNPKQIMLPFGNITVDYGSSFRRVKYADLFEQTLGFPMTDTVMVREAAAKHGVRTKNDDGVDLDHILVVNKLFEEVVEWTLDPTRPTFITHYPSAISPLTRPNAEDPSVADRADLFIAGMEIAPHYTELNDPDVQAEKFRQQLSGLDDEESTFRTFDADFIQALKVGMPPAGGMGLGIDRLAMLLTNQRTIRDVILFPLMRPVEER